MAKINLIAWNNQGGLSHDLLLLTQALEQLGHQVFTTLAGPRRSDGNLRALWQRLIHRNRPIFDINIMLEHIRPSFCWMARHNVFIPNPEWFSHRDANALGLIDAIFTKTAIATKMFSGNHAQTQYIGFTSFDHYAPEIIKKPSFLHLSGASKMKGTERLLQTWRRHPEWPVLTVYQSYPPSDPVEEPVNIARHMTRLDPQTVRVLQNSHLYHLCLSEAEGWGHYIVEAMSCAAVVFVCDAPPMNELVTPTRGCCIAAITNSASNQAACWKFDITGLEAAIHHAITMTPEQANRLGQSARHWYLNNHSLFSTRLGTALKTLTIDTQPGR